MKQHITPEQLGEISDQSRRKLDIWWRKNGNIDFGGWVDERPLLSIGQMIEFLDEHWLNRHGQKDCNIIRNDNEWLVGTESWEAWDMDIKYEKKELADALWEAVKEVLESEV